MNFLQKLFKVEPEVKIIYSADPIELVNRITEDKFKWYDYNELEENEKLKYYKAAQEALNNPVILNEMSQLYAEWAQWAIKQSHNFEGVMAMRYQMSGIQLLIQRLEEIADPTTKPKPAERPYEGI